MGQAAPQDRIRSSQYERPAELDREEVERRVEDEKREAFGRELRAAARRLTDDYLGRLIPRLAASDLAADVAMRGLREALEEGLAADPRFQEFQLFLDGDCCLRSRKYGYGHGFYFAFGNQIAAAKRRAGILSRRTSRIHWLWTLSGRGEERVGMRLGPLESES